MYLVGEANLFPFTNDIAIIAFICSICGCFKDCLTCFYIHNYSLLHQHPHQPLSLHQRLALVTQAPNMVMVESAVRPLTWLNQLLSSICCLRICLVRITFCCHILYLFNYLRCVTQDPKCILYVLQCTFQNSNVTSLGTMILILYCLFNIYITLPVHIHSHCSDKEMVVKSIFYTKYRI